MGDIQHNISKGKLYVVATPIGNLEDISFRAIKVLSSVDLIAAEDTRQTIKLLNRYQIQKPLTSYYEHNKEMKGNYLIRRLLNGENIAITSDAGTPGISDPGEDLIREAIANNIEVTVIPGPSAVIAGVVASGLPSGRFVFEGFLPLKKKGRIQRLEILSDEPRTMVFYEAPHKLKNTLKNLKEVLGNRNIAMARELTKKHEEIIRCTLDEAIRMYDNTVPQGEYVLVVEGQPEQNKKIHKQEFWNGFSIQQHVNYYISQALSKNDAIKKAAADRGIGRKQVYDEYVKCKNRSE